jgi:hypothetical protein
MMATAITIRQAPFSKLCWQSPPAVASAVVRPLLIAQAAYSAPLFGCGHFRKWKNQGFFDIS